MSDTTYILRCGDNFIYLCPCGQGRAFAVDPADGAIVLRALRAEGWTLAAALVTHHHADHTAGLRQLKAQTDCRIIGPDPRQIPLIDQHVMDGDIVAVGQQTLTVIGTPGHTATSVCYYMDATSPAKPGVLWTGDTLFIGGCGRPMECDAATLWQSLARLGALPDDTRVYCGHDYTAENYEFALTIEPDAPGIQRCLDDIARGQSPVPSTIGHEKRTNIFLRSTESSVRRALGMPDARAEQVFAELRQRKNRFG